MFNELCWQLNRVGLSVVAAGLRRVVAAVSPVTYRAYDAGDAVGYKGRLSSRVVGVVAFVQDDGKLVWRW